jgi:CMP-N-acetylneuraminic acid synthetase
VFDRIAFDDHTDQQVLFIEELDLDNCTFFWCGPQYRELFSHFLNSRGMSNRYVNYNYQHVTEDDPDRNKFKQIFKQVLEKNSKYITNLDNFFSKDYKLIRNIKFYNK